MVTSLNQKMPSFKCSFSYNVLLQHRIHRNAAGVLTYCGVLWNIMQPEHRMRVCNNSTMCVCLSDDVLAASVFKFTDIM